MTSTPDVRRMERHGCQLAGGFVPSRSVAIPQPLAGVIPTAPAGLLLFQHKRSRFGEGGDAPGAALLRQRVPTFTGELAVDERLLPGLGQGDEGEAAETELTAAATDDEALYPTTGSAGLDEEVEAVAVGVSSGRSGGKRPRGPLGDGGRWAWSRLTVGGSCLLHPFPPYMGMAVDCKG